MGRKIRFLLNSLNDDIPEELEKVGDTLGRSVADIRERARDIRELRKKIKGS